MLFRGRRRTSNNNGNAYRESGGCGGGSGCRCLPGTQCPGRRRLNPVCVENCHPKCPLRVEIAEPACLGVQNCNPTEPLNVAFTEPLCLGVRNCDPTEALLIDGTLGIENAEPGVPLEISGCVHVDNKDGKDFQVFVKNSCEQPLKVDANVWADVEGCITINTCPTDPIMVDGMIIVENGTEPFEISGCIGIENCDTDPLAVKIGWNKECPDAVPVFGRFEVCNCADDVFQVAIDGPIGIENATSDPLCVALENKNSKPLCVTADKFCNVSKVANSSSFALRTGNVTAQSGTYDVVTAPAEQVICLESVRVQISSNDDSLPSSTALGTLSFSYKDENNNTITLTPDINVLCNWGLLGDLRSPDSEQRCWIASYNFTNGHGAPLTLAPDKHLRIVWGNTNLSGMVAVYRLNFMYIQQPVPEC